LQVNIFAEVCIVILALQIVQIILSVAMITVILLQGNNSSVGSVFGGSGGFSRTRRGAEKVLYQSTIGLAIAFFLVSILIVVLG